MYRKTKRPTCYDYLEQLEERKEWVLASEFYNDYYKYCNSKNLYVETNIMFGRCCTKCLKKRRVGNGIFYNLGNIDKSAIPKKVVKLKDLEEHIKMLENQVEMLESKEKVEVLELKKYMESFLKDYKHSYSMQVELGFQEDAIKKPLESFIAYLGKVGS